jgi:dihydroorotate dehydrogenase electron transfer subunit
MQKPSSFVMDCSLLESKFLNDRYVLMIFQTPVPLPEIRSGQFAQVRIDGSPTTFLRRPISICMTSGQDKIWLLVQAVGDGTRTLVNTKPGNLVNMLLPLGKSFSLSESGDNALLIGGGVGVAPMLLLGKQLSEAGKPVTFLLGGRTASDLVMIEEFSKYGAVHCTTEDGSSGEKGFVTDHSMLCSTVFTHIYTCGPKPMMQAIASYAKNKGIECEVSLENLMACGIGACLCCVEDTVEGNVCTCKEGPVFNTKVLKW